MRVSMLTCATLLALSVAGSSSAQLLPPDPSKYEVLLVPIISAVGTPGGNGSLWKTQLTVRNTGDAPVTFVRGEDCHVVLFQPCLGGIPQIPAGGFAEFLPENAPVPGNPAVLYYVAKDGSDNVTTSLRVADVTRSDVRVGAEIPVVKEAQFRSDFIELLGLAVAPGWRSVIRVYSFDSRVGDAVRLRIYEDGNATPVLDRNVPLVRLIAVHPFSVEVAYGEWPLDSLVSSIGPLRAQIDSPGNGTHVWAFASTTSNADNHVVVTTPSR